MCSFQRSTTSGHSELVSVGQHLVHRRMRTLNLIPQHGPKWKSNPMWATCRASAEDVKRFTSVMRSELTAVKNGVLWGQQIGTPGTGGRHGQETWPVFRTGDLGRITKHGLELLGRTDNEVKIGGNP